MESNKQKETNAAEAAKQALGVATRKPTVAERVRLANSLTGLKQNEVAQYLDCCMKDRIAAVLPKHLTADRVIQIAATTINKNPRIAQCSPASLLGAVMQASILGFPPVDALGYCYFVPYGRDVQFQIGYRGMVELARRSGDIRMLYAETVREGDEFEVELGLYPKLVHKPKLDSSKPLIYVYAVCHFLNGGYNFKVLSRADVEYLRMRNPMQKGAPTGAWATDYEAMAKAKSVKQLSKFLPMSIDQQMALATDEAVIRPESFQNGKVKVDEIQYDEVVGEYYASSQEPAGETATGELFNEKTEGHE